MESKEKGMDNSGNEEQTGDKIPQKKGKKGKTAKELMTDHISDEEHVITDEEFKNIPYLFISSVAQQGLTELKDTLWKMLNN